MSENNNKLLAMAAPAALYITGAICLGIFALLTEQVPGSAIPVLVVWTQAAAVGIIIAGIVEIVRNNLTLGVLILVSGTMLCLGAGWGFEASRLLPVELWEKGLQMCGFIWLGIGVSMLLLLLVAAKLSWGLFFSQIIVGVAASLVGWGLVDRIGFGDGVVNIAGWLLLVYAIYAFYAATAFLVNKVYERKVLPI
jgi:succinate-acetate transporter protein